MAASGVSVASECVSTFNELKLGKQVKWIIYKISDNGKEIVVDESSKESDYEVFREKLINAKSKDRSGNESPGPRYAVYDVEYDAGEGKRNKIVFIAWSPDDAAVRPKMVYSSSKDALKRSLNGIGAEIQATAEDDIEFESIVSRVAKGR